MYDVLHTMLDSEPVAQPLIWPLFILINILCTYLIVGLFVAVITDTFNRYSFKAKSQNPLNPSWCSVAVVTDPLYL